jgi:hypothetical protein
MRLAKLRYRLATLLAVMTAVAVMLWAVPEWREYQRRMEFERAAMQLAIGRQVDVRELLPPHAVDRQIGGPGLNDFVDASDPPLWRLVQCYSYQRRWYCIVIVETAMFSGVPPVSPATREIYVYRFGPAPRSYRAQTIHVQGRVRRAANTIGLVPLTSRDQYVLDFLEVAAGREKSDLGIRYELIHADPPLTAKE